MRALIYIISIIITSSTLANQVDKFCEQKLNEEIKKLISSDDSHIIEKYYELSNLKMAYQLEKNDKNTLEKHIQATIEEIDDSSNRAELKQKLVELYQEYGITETKENTEELLIKLKSSSYYKKNTRIHASDMPSVVRILRFSNGDCSEISCLDESDEAVQWLVKEMKSHHSNSNLLDSSVHLAHYAGYVKDQVKLTEEESINQIAKLKSDIQNWYEQLYKSFLSKYEECHQLYEKSECFKQRAQRSFTMQIKELIKAVNLTQNDSDRLKIPSLISKIKLGVTLNQQYLENLKVRKKEELAEKKALETARKINNSFVNFADHKDEANMCGGKKFVSKIKNIQVDGFSDPRKSFSTSKDKYQQYKDGGTNAMTKGHKNLGWMKKFEIPGPFFRCGVENVRKIPKISIKRAQQLVCCKEQEQWKDLMYIFANVSGGFTCRFFIGIPYIAEVGAKLGAGIGVNIGGGLQPKECKNSICVQGSVSFNVSAAIYAEVVSGLAGLQGTISWVPYASVKQCIQTNKPVPPANIGYKVGNVLLIGTVRGGWFYQHDVVKSIYENHNVTSMDVAIF